MNNFVVVGYDQTLSSDQAVTEAAVEAEARRAALRIVTAYQDPSRVMRSISVTSAASFDDQDESRLREDAETAAELAAESVRTNHPGLGVEARAVAGHAAKALVDASHGAGLLVLGNRGRGGLPGLRLGSVPLRVMAGARCPLIVVRGDHHPKRNRIRVAIDIDGPCDQILDFAFTAATARDAAMEVAYVWDEPWFLPYDQDDRVPEGAMAITQEFTARLEAILQPWKSKYSDVPVTQTITAGPAGTELVADSQNFDLLVVGAQLHGGNLHGMRVGAVAHTVLHHADCPVAVIPLG